MVEAFKVIDVEIHHHSFKLPLVLADLYSFIRADITEGIFRINGSLKKVNQYHSSLNKYNKWLNDANIYDICSLLKKTLITNYKFIDPTKLDFNQLGSNDSFNWDYFNKFLNNNLNPLSFNIFLYTLHFLNELLSFNDITKMTLLNYSIIFQPIFFPCESLIGLPNFINLLNFLLQNKDLIKLDSSLIDEDFKLALQQQNTFSDTSFLYKFKNFKNKSIDSINDISKKLPFDRGYRMSNKSYDLITTKEVIVEKDSSPEDPDNTELEEPEILDTLQLTSDQVDQVGQVGPSAPSLPADASSSTDAMNIESDVLSMGSVMSHSGEAESAEFESTFEQSKETILKQETHDTIKTANDHEFHGLDPLHGPDSSYRLSSFKFTDIDQIDPLTVDPVVNEVINLKEIDTPSFHFNIDVATSSTTSFHSVDDLESSVSNVNTADSNNLTQTNDTSFQITDLSNKPSSSSMTSKAQDKQVSDSSLIAPSTKERKGIIGRKLSSLTNERRNSTLLSRIESRLSTADGLSTDKRKSFIRLFKNEGSKFPFKLKSKSVY